MTAKIMPSTACVGNVSGSNSVPVKDTDTNVKTTQVFKKEISESDEREAYIGFFMKNKQVSREVAAAEYDFFA